MSTPDLPPLPSNPNEDAGPEILGAVLSTTSLAVLVLFARFYVRVFMVRALGWDDYTMGLAGLLVSDNAAF
jgi:hypothetical protein